MGAERRAFWRVVVLVSLIPLTGCASRGSVRFLSASVASLQTKVEEANRSVAQITSTVKETEAGLARQARQVEGMSQRTGRLEERLQGVEASVKEVKGAVDTLTVQVGRLAGRAPDGLGVETVDRLFASALGHYQSGNLGQAVLEFTDLIAGFPKHPLAENAQFWIGVAYFAQQDFRQALVEFRKVVDQYPRGSKVPDALYKIGLAHRSLFEAERAREVWGRLIRDFPGSEPARMARTPMSGRPPAPQK